MSITPHKDKLLAAISNPKCRDDMDLLREAEGMYHQWVTDIHVLEASGRQRVDKMVDLLNAYKDHLEVELIAKRGTPFIKRQKGQLKLDNSVLEEFLVYLVDPRIIEGLPEGLEIEKGPHTAFMSLCFRPTGISALNARPSVVLKEKDQDFTIGKSIYYKFSPTPEFETNKTLEGNLYLSVFAAEIKVNRTFRHFESYLQSSPEMRMSFPSKVLI